MDGYVKEISEEKRLQNILASCDKILEREPGNMWWENLRENTRERLGEIYAAEYILEIADDTADLRACALFKTSL